jgi:hypothetical protein
MGPLWKVLQYVRIKVLKSSEWNGLGFSSGHEFSNTSLEEDKSPICYIGKNYLPLLFIT